MRKPEAGVTRTAHYDWLAHFDNWFELQFGREIEEEGIVRLRGDMVAMFVSDQEYWSRQSYWQLHDAVCADARRACEASRNGE